MTWGEFKKSVESNPFREVTDDMNIGFIDVHIFPVKDDYPGDDVYVGIIYDGDKPVVNITNGVLLA